MARKEMLWRRKNDEDELDSPCPSVILGGHYVVKRKNNVIACAKILHRRYNGIKKVDEYYARFECLNRRLDEWVPHNKILSIVKESARRLVTRNLRTREPVDNEANDSDLVVDKLIRLHEERSEVKYIEFIQLGKYEIDTWYSSPFPNKYSKQKKLYICEYCLKYMLLLESYRFHLGDCKWRQPPGIEIYHKGALSVYEIDPVDYLLYCQNLCLLTKLFVEHKYVVFNVESFLFYVLCEVDNYGSHVVGYFSKSKELSDGYNVACILILPPFQRKGYGKFLIAFSYELSKLDGVVGTPETPLSDLGLLSYRSYWSWVLLDTLKELRGAISIKELSRITSITKADIISTLQSMDILKYWFGKEMICFTPKFIYECMLSTQCKPPRLTVDKSEIS